MPTWTQRSRINHIKRALGLKLSVHLSNCYLINYHAFWDLKWDFTDDSVGILHETTKKYMDMDKYKLIKIFSLTEHSINTLPALEWQPSQFYVTRAWPSDPVAPLTCTITYAPGKKNAQFRKCAVLIDACFVWLSSSWYSCLYTFLNRTFYVFRSDSKAVLSCLTLGLIIITVFLNTLEHLSIQRGKKSLTAQFYGKSDYERRLYSKCSFPSYI